MSNFIEKNPVKSLVIYTITVVLAVWGILTFILHDNKETLHKNQIENLNTKIEVMEEKISFLEYENSILKNNNQKYLEWLQSIPQSAQFFTKKIENLERKNAELSAKVSAAANVKKTDAEKYYLEETLNEGDAFFDKKTGATIGFNSISTDKKGTGILNLPGQKGKILKDISAGSKWEFSSGAIKYELVVKEINYIKSAYAVILREL